MTDEPRPGGGICKRQESVALATQAVYAGFLLLCRGRISRWQKGIIAAHPCFAVSMSLLLRPRNLFVLLSYLLLSCTPFVARLFGHPVAHPGTVLGIELILWIGVWALFKRPAYFHWLLLPAFLCLPVELYLYAFYGQGISTHHLGIIFETSPAEAMEFLGQKVWLLGGVFVGVLAWFIACWIAAWRTRDLDWRGVSRPVVLGLLVLSDVVFVYSLEFGIAP